MRDKNEIPIKPQGPKMYLTLLLIFSQKDKKKSHPRNVDSSRPRKYLV